MSPGERDDLTSVEPGHVIPPWEMPRVDPQRMKTMAAILRDPYPVHWDRDAVEAMGMGRIVINQGPLNLSYVANMLMAWAGDDSVRRLEVTFPKWVVDEDRVVATGVVTAVTVVAGERRAVCDIQLERDVDVVLAGTAEVALGPA
ncbi:MAG: MaoC/PaaZ C-terminal domain-containing protein [Acidimicrobiales bacterium]